MLPRRIRNRVIKWRRVDGGRTLPPSDGPTSTSLARPADRSTGTTLVNISAAMHVTQRNTHEHQPSLTAANEWFEALDQRTIGRGADRWIASVLRVHVDEREWWIDVASANNPAANVVLRLSRQATVFHAVAALRRHRPRTESCAPVIDVMRVC